MFKRQPNEWGLIIRSIADGVRPTSNMGAAVTPGANNTYGSWVTLLSGAQVTDDVFEIEICVNGFAISAAARDGIVGLGLDPNGGTSFTSIADLVCGPASVHSQSGGGTFYRFPLYISKGTSIGVRAAVNAATTNNCLVFCTVKCRPSQPDKIFVGQFIDQYGVDLTQSAGTAVTPGTTTEGAWTQLGTLSRSAWYFEFGYGSNNATMSVADINVDIGIGDASNKKIVIPNAYIVTTASEQLSKPAPFGNYGTGVAGDGIYGRVQSSAADSCTLAVYAVGG